MALHFKPAREVKDSLETDLLDNNSNNVLPRIGRNVQQKSNSVTKHRATTQKTAEADELQARVDAAKAAKNVTDQAVEDAQTALSASEWNIHEAEVRLRPRDVCSPLGAPHRCSAISDVEPDLTPVTATISALPVLFIDPSPAPARVDFALPFDFGDDLAWLDNLGFVSKTSQPLDVSLNNVSFANTVPNDKPGGTEFQLDANGELDCQLDWNARGADSLDPSSSTGAGGINFEGWDTDIVSAEPELPILPPPPALSPYSSPAALQAISPPPIEVLNADIDGHNIVHFSCTRNPTDRVLETVGTAVQSKAKKPKSKRSLNQHWNNENAKGLMGPNRQWCKWHADAPQWRDIAKSGATRPC
ncbi:hypothetical protein DFH08DRAFT_823041 [Mycena albidolilacea]|uniref:Uncharacterized protein n=1 Tax=Mycena albidolilacea TaxID=1033008 RepID=A0AAD6Z7C9_9AGAR|nr:hypothetical protein DFH08DRAFT_823041 [Mycena albidolilacea]